MSTQDLIPLLLSLVMVVAVLAAGAALLAAGVRTGDRFGEASVSGIGFDPLEGAVRFTVHNPGDQSVLIGASVRRRSLRLRLEGGYLVRVPRVTTSDGFLAGRHSVIRAVPPGEREAVLVPLRAGIGRRSELVVVIGERERLRVIHRSVDTPGPYRSPAPEEGAVARSL